MKAKKLLIILAATALVVTGCKGAGAATDTSQVIESAEGNEAAEATEGADTEGTQTTDAPKEEADVTTAPLAILPEFEIVTEQYQIESEDGIRVVGSMQEEYLHPTVETVKEYPKLCESIEGFNQTVWDNFDTTRPGFTDMARDYYSNQAESTPEGEYIEGWRYNFFLNELRADEKFTSFYLKTDFFQGENDTHEYYYCYNFDSKTGETLKISDVIIDDEEFNNAVMARFSNKFGDNLDYDVYDPNDPDSLNWCLTPIGINVYFDNDGFNSDAACGLYVNIDFDSFPEAIDSEYKSDCFDYVYPFDVNDGIDVDIDGDGEANLISFDPIFEDEETNDYKGYTVSVDGKIYDDFDEKWFYDCRPYFVHNSEGNFIYAKMVGYDENWLEIISFDTTGPKHVESMISSNLDGRMEVDEELFSKYVRPAFTNSSIFRNVGFSDLVYGPYIVTDIIAGEDSLDDEGNIEEDTEPKNLEFYEVDGRLYAEYVSTFNYGASEIELMDSKPKKVGEDYIFTVRFHYFSGFSFSGDYHGGGYICDITVHENGSITIAENNPFAEGSTIELDPLYEARIHGGILDYAAQNTECPAVEGSWRYQGMTEYDEIFENYLELHDDGTAYFYTKNDTYPINLNIGIYSVLEGDNEGEYVVSFDGETMGYACMPCDTAVFIYNFEEDTLTPQPRENEVGGDEVEYWRTEPGDWGYSFGNGPASRTDELLVDWNEYNS